MVEGYDEMEDEEVRDSEISSEEEKDKVPEIKPLAPETISPERTGIIEIKKEFPLILIIHLQMV